MKNKILSVMTSLFVFAASQTVGAQEISVLLDGTKIAFDVQPIICEDRTLVPMRAVFEAYGMQVFWSGEEQSIFALGQGTQVFMMINYDEMYVNSTAVRLEVPPMIYNDRTLVPIRAISEALGCAVNWDSASQTVIVSSQTDTVTPPKDDTVTPPENSGSTTSALEQECFRLVNEVRSQNGLSALSWADDLANVARAHSADMIARKFFSHTNPDGLSPFDRMKNGGISYGSAAENIAYGQSTANQVMDSWMNSAGHRANILSSSVKEIGIGAVVSGGGTVYWTQNFISRR